jgi:hypothetical protein
MQVFAHEGKLTSLISFLLYWSGRIGPLEEYWYFVNGLVTRV